MRVELTTSSTIERYKRKGTPGPGRLKTGGMTMVFLKAKNACLRVSSHRNGLVFLSNL